LYAIENFLLKRSAAVSTITSAMVNRALAKGVLPDRILLVPNWAATNTIVPTPTENTFRKRQAIGPEKILVIYSGAIGKKQGLDLLLDAAHRLQEDTRFAFLVIGTGADRLRLVARALDLGLTNLEFLPVQPECMFSEVLASADIHLAIQKREAADLVMPSKLTNILSAGRPTIATAERGSSIWEVLEENDAGICVPPGDCKALADSLRALADDAATRLRMGHNARSYAEKYLNQDRILKVLEKALIKLNDR
jgi:colanic acid biosynthesis glycosyl transferase WcaI